MVAVATAICQYFYHKTMTNRQRAILQAIINEFMNSAEAVGSLVIAQQYDLGVSPATIRSEMARLVDEGFIEMSHSSSGRVPTTLAFRYFINEIMDEEEIPHLEELEISRRIFEKRFTKERLVKQALDVTSEVTRCLTLALFDGTVFLSGVSELVRYPEFQEIDNLQGLLAILESCNIMSGMFRRAIGDNPRGVSVLVGEETGVNALGNSGVVFKEFSAQSGGNGILAIIGPARMDYSRAIPVVKLVTDRLNNAVFGW